MENKSPGLNELGSMVAKSTLNAEVTNSHNDGTKCTFRKFADDRKHSND